MMKRILAKIIGITILIVLLMQNIYVFALTEKEELENKKQQNEKEMDEIREKQEQIEANKSETLKTVEDLIGKISSAEAEVDSLEKEVGNLRTQIDLKEKDIQQKQEEYTKLENMLDERLIAIYESGQTSYLDVLLTSSSMTDFLAKYYAATELIEYDKELMKMTKDQKEQIQNEKNELEEQKKELDTSLIRQEAKTTELKSLKKTKENQVNQLTEEEKKLQQEMEKANKNIEKEIKEAEIRYQKQLEALQKSQGGVVAGSGYFMRPVSSGTITATSHYSSGKFHGGVDFGVPEGTTVMAAADGVVMSTANLSTSYGTYVVIRHANGLQTYYAHGTRGSIVVQPGDSVKKGQKIMLSGNTGNSTGPHLHFEVRVSPYNYSYSAKNYGQDSRVNPLNYL